MEKMQRKQMIQKLGPVKATVIITLCTVLFSASITIVATVLVLGRTDSILFGIMLSTLLPGIITPVITYAFLQLLTKVEETQQEKDQAIRDLTEALANVRRLNGLLPICASCKKIRDDEGYWHQVEDYIHTHAEVDFSHGICPECTVRLYPKMRSSSGQRSTPSSIEVQP